MPQVYDMIIGIHQLHYLPWIRYFHKLANCDIFVVLDNIQFNKNGWQNRNKIKCPDGWLCLTVPVYHRYQQSLQRVSIDNTINWRRKHWRAIQMNYSRAKFFSAYKNFFEEIYAKEWTKLNDINFEILGYIIKALGINVQLIRASRLKVKGEATQRLVNICKELGAETYLTGAYATEVYLDVKLFRQQGIEVVRQDYTAPIYSQRFPKAGFIPNLSIIDVLFNEGPGSLEIILEKKVYDKPLSTYY